MEYEGIIIRPPSEAHSLILQVTLGCSHNRCIFCPAYKLKRFRLRHISEIERDLLEVRPYACQIRRVFLADGDALSIPQSRLLEILKVLNRTLPQLQRIGIYGNAKGILGKSVDELTALKEQKLSIVYLGVETGDEETLRFIHKGVGYAQMLEAGRRIKAAGMKLSVTVLLGVAGISRSAIHARETARILTEMQPDYVGALTLMILPEAPLYRLEKDGLFILPSPFGMLQELRIMIAQSELSRCLFFSNHASNYLPLKARLPRDKETTLKLIDRVISTADETLLTPEFMRSL